MEVRNFNQNITAPISIQEGGTLIIAANVGGGITFVEWGGTTSATGTFSFSGADAFNYGTVGNYATFGENISNYGTVGDYSTCNGCFNEFGGVFGDNATFNGASNNEGGCNWRLFYCKWSL